MIKLMISYQIPVRWLRKKRLMSKVMDRLAIYSAKQYLSHSVAAMGWTWLVRQNVTKWLIMMRNQFQLPVIQLILVPVYDMLCDKWQRSFHPPIRRIHLHDYRYTQTYPRYTSAYMYMNKWDGKEMTSTRMMRREDLWLDNVGQEEGGFVVE